MNTHTKVGDASADERTSGDADKEREAPPTSDLASKEPTDASDRMRNIEAAGSPDGPVDASSQSLIDDTPPQRVRDLGDLVRTVGTLIAGILIVLIAVYLRGVTQGIEYDVHTASQALDWLYDLPTSLLQQFTTIVVVLIVLFHLLFTREFLQAITSSVALFCGYGAVWAISTIIVHTENQTIISALSPSVVLTGASLLPDIYAGIGAFLSAAGPRRLRASVKWGWNILYATAIIVVALSANAISGVLLSFCIGRIIGLGIRYLAGTQSKGAWGPSIVQSLKSIGITVHSLRAVDIPSSPNPFGNEASLSDDLVDGSRLYEVEDLAGTRYTVSVLDAQKYTAGYLIQLWQWLKFSGVSMRRDRSVRDTTQHHFAMLLGLRNLGLTTVRPYGVAESGESSLLVLESDSGLHSTDVASLSDDDLRELCRYLDKAIVHGFTNRGITPGSIAKDAEGHCFIAGWQNGDFASSSANSSIDRVQLLTMLACTVGKERAVEVTRDVWGDDLLIGLIPFLQKVAVPAATKALPGWDKRLLGDLRNDLRALTSQEAGEALEPVTLSRFNLRSFLALVLLVVAVAVVLTQLNLQQVIYAIGHAEPWMAVLCFVFGVFAWIGSGISLGAFMDADRRNYLGIFMSQVAASFTAVSMPAGVGPAFVNLQFLRKSGYRSTVATAIMSAVIAVQFLTTFLLLILIGVFTGRNSFSSMIPTNTLVIVLGVVAILASLSMAITPVRKLLIDKLLPIVTSYARQLLDVLTQPRQLLFSALGALVQSLAFGLSFWAALKAFGYPTNVLETTFIFMLANTLGSAVPTPGGLGAVEAALTFGFSGLGVPTAVALSATLLFRVATYWLRIPLGALAMKWLNAHNLV
ncbi:lysylphosphatidylglycerol synthase transmembrane domain-containing protein [Bifidobacterium crudilactis]|jgi:uncharacterized protein (TIRG00374 family)|uniref:lysylphosphatidylglycerol synthase transmembrane domain-containing protein n=1 Tax=Bifidobacterium crudilactis TaxID=327277 RepID=UPI0039C8B2AA